MTEPPISLTRKAMASVRALSALQVATVLMQVAFLAAASRLLDAKAFGVFAVAGIVLRLVGYLSDLGLGSALVQRRNLGTSMTRQANGACMAAGAALTTLVVVLAEPLVSAVHQRQALGVTIALAFVFVLDSVGTTPSALLRRSHAFGKQSMAEGAGYAVGYLVVGIPCAASGLGAYSLAAAALVQTATRSGLLLLWSPGPRRPSLPAREVVGLLRFGTAVSGIGFMEFWSSNLDSAAVGRWEGAAPLGQYSRASSLVGLPMQYLGQAITRALLPAFAQGTSGQVRRGVVDGLSLLSAVCIPVMAVAAVTAHPLIGTVLGPGWAAAARVLPVVCAAVTLNTLTQVPAVACEARGLLRPKAAVQLVHLATVIVGLGMVRMARGGLEQYAIVWLVGEAVRHVGYVVLADRRLGAEAKSIATAYAGALLMTTPVAALAAGVTRVTTGPVALVLVTACSTVSLLAVLAAAPWWPVRAATRRLHLVRDTKHSRIGPILERLVA